MDKKYNSTTNPKYLNNHRILNLKSTSQRTNMNNYSNASNKKNDIKYQCQKGISGNLLQNNLIYKNHNNKTFNANKRKISDDISIDNISNIISYKKNKLPNIQMNFEKKQSLNDNNSIHKINPKNYKSFSINTSNNNICNNNTTNILCDSHTKSFQLKLKKMQEMNRTILKENFIMMNNTFDPWKNSWFNRDKISKSIINCKQKIISMKIKNQLLTKNFYSENKGNNNINGKINNKLVNSVNGDNDNKVKKNVAIPLLCCTYKS
jgi:hypothetical protein